jgi:hypothetical protein
MSLLGASHLLYANNISKYKDRADLPLEHLVSGGNRTFEMPAYRPHLLHNASSAVSIFGPRGSSRTTREECI